ncbi:double-strand break repair protein AddB [Algicella marina]|uniref:double-strand break repair protein AddB n=1 Tax=Algicella marina TaxID=2683284 RepID=UPI00137A583C|nr:double-strand break repair protein AddB [Algicella marina]
MTVFPPSLSPRVFALPPGADFSVALLQGLEARMQGQSAISWARTEIYLNTQRASRRLETLLQHGPVRLQPKITTLDRIGQDLPAYPPLRRRLELAKPVRKLLEVADNAGARIQAFDLAESLMTLSGEMQERGIAWESLSGVSSEHLSHHWQRSLKFLELIRELLESGEDSAGRRRAGLLAQAARWTAAPPEHPVIIAGSTGSRGAVPEFMAAAAALPNGAVILPVLDPYLPLTVWQHLQASIRAIDHPQWGLARLTAELGISPGDIPDWVPAQAPCEARNRLASLALRPAPVTDQWVTEGPALTPALAEATAGLALVEAPSLRAEAEAIALLFRRSLSEGVPVALVTPDRTLARRVTAEMDRWGLAPDDSAGRPLSLTPPGVFLRRCLRLTGWDTPAATLLGLLKHPLTASGPEVRGPHMRKTRALELERLRRTDRPFTAEAVAAWAADKGADWAEWADWLAAVLAQSPATGDHPPAERLEAHLAMAETLAAGPGQSGSGELWEKEAGEAASRACDALREAAPYGDPLDLAEYRTLLTSVLAAEDVPDAPFEPHPGIAIWGTLEARTQSAPRVVLGGLNEGIWPRLPKPDPWLNRDLRARIGLPPAERQIGLSAHDFQQGFGAAEVYLTRATRDAEAETVASRWLLRLDNLLSGLGKQGEAALDHMRGRGQALLTEAAALNARPQAAPAPRPAPVPPLAVRPDRLAATRIEKLIRDPYAIYARYILGLRPLDPLGREPDARERGNAAHLVFERFIAATKAGLPSDAADLFRATVTETLEECVPWPATRALWQARLTSLTDWFLETEAERRARATPALFEAKGSTPVSGPPAPFTLEARADRIDIGAEGVAIYDYKGSIPSGGQMLAFQQQLQLEAIIAAAGGFDNLPAARAIHLEMIGLSGGGRLAQLPPKAKKGETQRTLAETIEMAHRDLVRLITAYQTEGTAYPARLRPDSLSYEGDYDHLSRLGEWTDGEDYTPEPVS